MSSTLTHCAEYVHVYGYYFMPDNYLYMHWNDSYGIFVVHVLEPTIQLYVPFSTTYNTAHVLPA